MIKMEVETYAKNLAKKPSPQKPVYRNKGELFKPI
jgi:hypothetical protein